MKKYFWAYILILSLTVFASCGEGDKKGEASLPTVTVTIEPLRYFTEQIARGKVEVNTMVPQGSNPETYEPTARQMMSLSGSTLYIKVGLIGFETTWMEKLQQNTPEMTVVDSSVGIVPAKTVNGVTDPHTWMSCTSAKVISRNIYQALLKLSPRDSLFFRANYEQLLAHIAKIDSTTQQLLRPDVMKTASGRKKNSVGTQEKSPRAFVIYHPTLTYFARDYGFTQLPIEEEGREPSARQIQALIDRALRENITTVFVQKEFANRNVQTFLTATHATPTEINPLSYAWEKEMLRVARTLAQQ